MKPYYFLEFYSSGFKTELSVNHFPILTESVGYEKATTQVINRWLGQRNNKISLSIDFPDYPKVQHEDDPEIPEEQSIRIRIYDGQQTPQGMEVNDLVWDYKWPQDENDKFVKAINIVEMIDKSLPALPITRLWQYSEKLNQLEEQDSQDLLLVYKTIRGHFAQQQYDKAYQFFKYRYEDEEIAEYIDQGAIKKGVLDMWRQYLPDPNLKMNQVDYKDVVLKLLDNERVVLLTMANGDYPIEFENSEEGINFGIPLYFCKINGHWLVIR